MSSMQHLRILLGVLVVLLVATVTTYLVLEPDGGAPASAAAVPPTSADEETGYAVGTVPDEADDALSAAVEALPLALSYDYRSLDQGLEKATALMTDAFAAEFRETFAATAAQQAETKDAVTQATVRAAGVVRVDGDEVLCLVYVDQVLVSSDTTRDQDRPVQVSQNRVLVGLTDDDGSWRLSSIQPI